jgi:hypothetical protein
VDDCIEWDKRRNRKGYGERRVNGVHWYAHRYAWFEVNGPIPEGMHVLHTCDNPACVNIKHLWLGTNLDNMKDRDSKKRQWNARKTVCDHGHPFDDENTAFTKNGNRQCIACSRERASKHYWTKVRVARLAP